MVLIDIGIKHNFINTNIAKRLKNFIYPLFDMKVMVAHGNKIECIGKFHKAKF